MAHLFAALFGAALIVVVLLEVFETIVLPRRVMRRWRLTRLLYRVTWTPWQRLAALQRTPKGRENALSAYGPLAVFLLLGVWALLIIIGFATLQWANGSTLVAAGGEKPTVGTDLYFSATTFLTLGLGDVFPRATGLARPLTALEAGGGFGILALVIGYLPALYSALAGREVAVSMLDERAGSPPSAGELLRRYAEDDAWEALDAYLRDWETWAAELLESHLSYPLLAYFRSQHDNQSWLAALTTILDTCALMLAAVEDLPGRRRHQARLTYAMARHAVVDLARVLLTAPRPPRPERLTADDVAHLRDELAACGRVWPASGREPGGVGPAERTARGLRALCERALRAAGPAAPALGHARRPLGELARHGLAPPRPRPVLVADPLIG